ncbi:MAG: hypothetical protein WDN04_20305 [Rhodospirillales bacterium]
MTLAAADAAIGPASASATQSSSSVLPSVPVDRAHEMRSSPLQDGPGSDPTSGRTYLNGVYAVPPDTSTPALLGYSWDYTLNHAYQDNCRACGVSGLDTPDFYPVIIDLYHVQSSYPDFAAAAQGAYDRDYRQMAQQLVAHASRIYAVRIDSEFNGSWSAASAFVGEHAVAPTLWIGGFRRLATAIQKALPKAKIIWNPNIGQHDPFPYYPGDDVVDLVGPDLYCQPRYHNSAERCWNDFLQGAKGTNLDAFATFARSHHKSIAIPEWGDLFGDGYMIRHMRAWMDQNAVVAQSYWDSGDALASTAALPALKANQRAYVEAFGNRPYTGTYWEHVIPVLGKGAPN